MLASEILLFLFICQWIWSQYKEAESRLHTDTQLLFTTVENKILDSLLDRQVAAVMKGKPGIDTLYHPEIPAAQHTLSPDSGKARKSIHLYSTLPETTAPLHQNDTVPSKTIILNPARAQGDQASADKVLRIALQEIINTIDIKSFQIPTDTALLRKEFSSVLTHRFQGLNLSWTNWGDTSAPFIYKHKDATQDHSYLSLTGYPFYLFKEVLPQGIFCLVLLLISSLAFLLAYLNTRKQNLFVRQKDDFISNISHELKTPVATAKIAIEALIRYDAIEDPERTRRYLAMADWELNRLETMISKIMDTTQADHDVLTLDKQKIHLAGLVQEITSSLQQVLIQEEITLEWNVPTEEVYIQGDRTHLTGVIYNLLDNAVKYGKERISIDLYNEDHKAHLKISDKGPGIPAAYREKIFEKFVRIGQGDIHNIKGYGLGLSYARYIIDAHKGSLKLEQATGWGAIFHICLPEWQEQNEV